MCGIVGIVWSPGLSVPEHVAPSLRSMTNALAHRGPDDSGEWIDPGVGMAFGHRRLSILDLSEEGHQPMHSACGRYTIVYNGEVYNFEDIRSELRSLGHRFRGTSDTEVVLSAFSQWGVEEATKRFNGMFAFAVCDRTTRTLYLARDRMGEKPLYYGYAGKELVFASELKAFWGHTDFTGAIDRNVLALYFRYLYIPAPYSVYQRVWKVPPGTIVRIDVGSEVQAHEPKPYWSLRNVALSAKPAARSVSEAVEELDALLRDAVKIRMRSDVPLGAFLSGGIDSSIVVALMQAQSADPIRTFTIGVHRPEDEADRARGVAAHLGTRHTEQYATPEAALALVPTIAALYDEPFADSSQIATFLVSRLARENVSVSLSGDGGDEPFAGYHRHFWRLWERLARFPRIARRLGAAGLHSTSTSSIGKAMLGYAPATFRRNVLHKTHVLSAILGANGPEQTLQGLVSFWPNSTRLVLGSSEVLSTLTDLSAWPPLSVPTRRMMYLDAMTYLPDDILVKVDRATMGVSLESRAPFLDHRLVEWSWSVPIEMHCAHPQGKALLRKILHRYIPPALVDGPKTGFGVPIAPWLRGPLQGWANDLLSPDSLRSDGILQVGVVEEAWREFLAFGTGDQAIWGVLMFQEWFRRTKAAAPACATT